MSELAQSTNGRRPVIYLILEIHRRGGMERAAFEVIERLKAKRAITVIACECENQQVNHLPVQSFGRPALLEVSVYTHRARRLLRQHALASPQSGVTTGVGSSGGPVDVIIAQFCQEAYRQKIGPVRASSGLRRAWHRFVMARYSAGERKVYQSPQLKRIIAVSRGVGRELIESYGVDPAIIRYIPNGVDLATFKPLAGGINARRRLRAELRLPTEGLLACFVGGDWRRKGLAPAIQAVGQVPHAHLVVVGGGDQAAFEAIAHAVGAADRIHFTGKQLDPYRYMQAADVYLFPSLYEAFSLSCIEAAACGLPLLVTKINGTEELVRDGENGFFVEHDAGSIAPRLRQLAADAQLRERMSAQAAADAKQYSWDAVAAAHEAVYAELDALASDTR